MNKDLIINLGCLFVKVHLCILFSLQTCSHSRNLGLCMVRVILVTVWAYLYHLSSFVDLWYCDPFTFTGCRLLEDASMIISWADGQHETNWTPAAPPNGLSELLLPCLLPLLLLMLRLFLIQWFTPPDSDCLVLTNSGDHLSHNSYIIAPRYISHPIAVGFTMLCPCLTQLPSWFVCLAVGIFSPDFNLAIHSCCDKSTID